MQAKDLKVGNTYKYKNIDVKLKHIGKDFFSLTDDKLHLVFTSYEFDLFAFGVNKTDEKIHVTEVKQFMENNNPDNILYF